METINKCNLNRATITLCRGKSINPRNEFLKNLNINGLKLLGEKDSE